MTNTPKHTYWKIKGTLNNIILNNKTFTYNIITNSYQCVDDVSIVIEDIDFENNNLELERI